MFRCVSRQGGKFVLKPEGVISRLKKFRSCCACETPSALAATALKELAQVGRSKGTLAQFSSWPVGSARSRLYFAQGKMNIGPGFPVSIEIVHTKGH